MDWQALALSVKLSLVTLLFLLAIGIFFATRKSRNSYLDNSDCVFRGDCSPVVESGGPAIAT